MALRGTRRRRSVDRGFVLSDHADWSGLQQAISATGAGHIGVTHGYVEPFARWLDEQGYATTIYPSRFEGELDLDDSDVAGEADEGESSSSGLASP